MKSLFIGILFACAVHILGFSQEHARTVSTVVTAGELFELSAPLELPPEVRISFDLYMDTLKTGAPLPFPYSIESYSLKDGVITIFGRCTTGGMYEIPLGIFCYAGQTFFLPSWHVTVNEIRPVVIRAKNLLYPYPKQYMAISDYNWRVQNSYDLQFFRDLSAFLTNKRHMQYILGLSLLCAMIVSLFYRAYQIYRASHKSLPQDIKKSLHEEFMALSKRYALGDRSSTSLLGFLNLPCGLGEPKTSFELEEVYKQCGDMELARACSLIEEHGYLPQGEEYMDEAFNILKKRFDSECRST
jgi:hypothetical protein